MDSSTVKVYLDGAAHLDSPAIRIIGISTMKYLFVSLLILASFAVLSTAKAALVMSDTGDQTENFDFLDGATGHFWANDQVSRSFTGSPGWYWDDTESGVPYLRDNGSNSNGEGFSYGSIGSNERAMGSLNQDSNADIAWGVVFQNSSGFDITSITVSYTGEQWRARTGGLDSLAFSYRTDGTEVTDFNPAGGETPTGWTGISALDFTSPNTGNSGAIDGNNGTNQTSLSETIAVTLADGEFLSLRWHDDNVSSLDDGLAIDDLTVSFTVAAVPEPTGFALFGLVSGLAVCIVGIRRMSNSPSEK